MTYLETTNNYTEVAEEGKIIGFYFQIYSKEWIAFGLYHNKPVILGLWAKDVTAEGRIISYYRDTLGARRT
jgi:3-hydroxymyristoyl/3-hydroxydecanoyl-(acyl carrier protein) dehydratase